VVSHRVAAVVLASLGVAVSDAAVAVADPRFSAPVFRLNGTAAFELVSADFDGDGIPDLAARDDDRRVAVHRGRGDGSFGQPAISRAGVAGATDLVAADLNRDGKSDLIAGATQYSDVGRVDLLLNDGTGRFRRQRYSTESSFVALVAADVNSDGMVDLVMTRYDTGPSVLLGTGAGRFGALRREPGRGNGDLAVGDLNGDGRLDLALVSDADRAAVRLGNGNGTFGPERAFGPRDIDDLALADLNHDGKLDLAAGGEAFDSGAYVFLGNGDGTLGAASKLGVNRPPDSLAIADFDGDGHADIATDAGSSGRVVVLSGRGDGTFGPAQSVRWRGQFGPLVVTDVNRDGRPDLASGSFSRDTPGVSVLLNWTHLSAPPCVVVPVVRARLRSATREIKGAGCELARVRYRYSRKVRKNRVIAQRPGYGAVLPSHAQVQLVISRGRRR